MTKVTTRFWKVGNAGTASASHRLTRLRKSVESAANHLTGDKKIMQIHSSRRRAIISGWLTWDMAFITFPISEALLGAAYGQLKDALALAAPGKSAPPFDVGLPKSSANCMNCHYGVETMVVQRAGRDFPHSPHVLEQKLACTTCHSNEVKHGSMILDAAACNKCHHTPAARRQVAMREVPHPAGLHLCW